MQEKVLSREEAVSRLIRRSDMVACKIAFIDCKLPGSELKENYSLIGPGVTQSKDQVVNLTEKHGFSVGVAAMPAGTVNNLHVHFTAEVFMIYEGNWRFRLGTGSNITEIDAGPGDVLSIPTWIFRGFSNIGNGNGWIFTLLGGDDTGGIIWHPSILEAAAEHGMYLTQDNMLVDTQAGDPMPSSDDLLKPLNTEQMNSLRNYSPEEMNERVVHADQRNWSHQALLGCVSNGRCELAPVLGYGMTEDGSHIPKISNPHGFSVEWLRLNSHASTGRFKLREKLVIFVMKGTIELVLNESDSEQRFTLNEQDLFSVPPNVWRQINSHGNEKAEVTLVIAGDHRKHIIWPQEIIQTAQASGYVRDPNGYIVREDMLPKTALDVSAARWMVEA
ncbi:hypothetical protein CAP48_17115 [Advenella sp. S44]|uniref:hypothetical protein n=1 Tax=Advenella sp. S44 TaxID=1982755 RepID=UPI000C2A08EA|nr:hypothetical protein [Advenella sp. S44]PJX21034.1 hypothetical protein CAP48_17115 [Advenella sp. S44]